MLKNNFKKIMVDNNITSITSMMEISGLSRNAVNKLFHNRDLETIKLGTLMQICDALQCNLSDLIEYKPD